jgi:hypothetical protein
MTIGQLAAIGRRTGVAEIFGWKFSGFIAWWMSCSIYLSKLSRPERKCAWRSTRHWTSFSRRTWSGLSAFVETKLCLVRSRPKHSETPKQEDGCVMLSSEAAKLDVVAITARTRCGRGLQATARRNEARRVPRRSVRTLGIGSARPYIVN